jgi:hypothetical protein
MTMALPKTLFLYQEFKISSQSINIRHSSHNQILLPDGG